MALPQDVSVGGIEVVAYDPRDPSVVYSPDGFRCNPSPGVGDQGESTCTQRLQMTEANDVVSVLLVHPNGVHTASKLLTLGGGSSLTSREGVSARPEALSISLSIFLIHFFFAPPPPPLSPFFPLNLIELFRFECS